MWSRTYSVLLFHLVITLWICPLLIDGKDWEINPDDLKRGLERVRDETPQHADGVEEFFDDVAGSLKCLRTCENFNKQLIIREVLIRNRFKIFDEACNTYNDEKLLLGPPNPPPPAGNFFNTGPETTKYYKDYLDWQERMLDSGKIFCDPNRNLLCSSVNKCSCPSESKWKVGALKLFVPPGLARQTFKLGTCIIPPGGACKSPDGQKNDELSESPKYFDPLHVINAITEPYPALTCEALEYNKETGCSSIHADYFMGPICLNEELDKKLPIFKKKFNENSKVLGVGDTCDFDAHSLLYKSEALNAEKFNARLKALEDRQVSGVSICDLRKFLTCGKSGKCECLEPAVLNGTECSFAVSDRNCGNNPSVKAMIMKNSFVPEAQRQLAQGIEKLSMDGCGPKSICYTDLQNGGEMFCICKGFFTGENCDQVLTLFLPFTRPSSLPSDVKDTAERLKIFTDFNREALKFQEKLKLKSGEKCDFYKELEIRRLIRRIDLLNEPSTVMTKSDYETLMKAISNFAQGGGQYCLRNFDPERKVLSEHSPYNQPIECEYSARVCQTPLPAANQPQLQIISSHKNILDTYFSTLGCGDPCTTSIDERGGSGATIRNDVDRLENYLYNKTAFCVRPKDVGTKVNCETEGNGVNRKCTCEGANCMKVCSNTNATSDGVTGISRWAVNGGGGVILLFVFLTPFTLSV